MSASKNILPPAPSGLCFSKDEFVKENFEVDKFLHDCRKRASPETLRDDLRVYHKILQNALVELINNDYADFVNLSSNLAGMDKLIGNLTSPLEGFQAEIMQVQAQMTAVIDAISQKLCEKAAIRKARASLARLAGVVRSVETIERMLGTDVAADRQLMSRLSQGAAVIPADGQLIERTAGEYNKLLCYISQLGSDTRDPEGSANHSSGKPVDTAWPRFPLLSALQPRIDNIGEIVRQRLGTLMVSALQSRNVDSLARCLRSYGAIDQTYEAEKLFGQCIIRPLCDQIIQESRLLQQQMSGAGEDALTNIYKDLIDALPPLCSLLADVAAGKRGADAIEGYDFAVNGVWPEVSGALEKRLSLIFAPGDPDAFFKRYTATMHFVATFEQQCCCTVSSVYRLRAHACYTTFMAKWNVPVYFQIRLQEIMMSVEAALEVPFTGTAKDKAVKIPEGLAGHTSSFALLPIETAWCAVRDCWAAGVFVGAAAHRFWKLTLQIVARLAGWLADTEQIKAAALSKKENAKSASDDTENSSAATSGEVLPASSVLPALPGQTDSTSGSISYLMCLIADSLKFSSAVQDFFGHAISKRLLEIGLPPDSLHLYQDCLNQGCAAVDSCAQAYAAIIAEDIFQQSAPYLRLVTEIPRLYRKTNREVPAKPSAYVAGLTKPLSDFVMLANSEASAGPSWVHTRVLLPQTVERLIISNALSELFRQYESTATEVLTSVKKMEDSLKRLKRGKGSVTAGSTATVSDDDKIRLQVALDIDAFFLKLSELKVSLDDIPSYTALRNAGAAAAASCSK